MGRDAPAVSKEVLAENYLALFREFETLHLYRKAEDSLLVALEKLPQHPTLLSQLARLYLDLEMPAKALSAANKIIKHYPELPEGYRLRGQVHEMNGQFLDAIRDYQKSLTHTREDIPLVERLLKLQMNYGRLREALEIIHSYQVVLKDSLLFFEIQAEALLRLGNQTGAFNKMREALLRQRDNHRLLKRYLILAIQSSRKEPAEIYRILQTSIPHLAQLSPVDLDELQVTFYRQSKDFAAALEVIAKNLAADPDNRQWRKLRAMIFLEMGQLSEGIQILRELFVKDPADREVWEPLENYYLMQKQMSKWRQLVREVLQQQDDPLELFGYLRQSGNNPDWLKICDLTFDGFIKQVGKIELPSPNIRDITYQKLPAYALRLFLCSLVVEGRVPTAEKLWTHICQLREKKQLVTPFQAEDLEAAYPVWLFAIHIYFLFKQYRPYQVAFIPRLLQEENVALQVYMERVRVEIDLSLFVGPPNRRLKTIVKNRDGLRWRWKPNPKKPPEVALAGMRFFSPQQFEAKMDAFLRTLRKEYPQYVPNTNHTG